MRKILLILLIIFTVFSFLAADTMNFTALEEDFNTFSTDLASSLPYASTIGLNWSSAFMGGFPKFGVGLTVGAVSLPLASFEGVASQLGFTLPSELTSLGIGVPFPAYTIDARVGIPILPLDVGLKAGFLDPNWTKGLPFGVDYLLIGADVRYSLIKQNLILPAVSVGVGYNYMSGGIVVSDVVPATTLNNVGGYTVSTSQADMVYAWSSNVIDVKAQVSKDLLIFTPAFGLGYSYGFSSAGGGMDSTILVNGSAPSAAQISAIESATGMTLSDSSLRILSESTGGSLRAWAGSSINIVFLRFDVSAMYNVLSNQWGGTFNVRFQL
jgi:hypothetical protein